jgi:hypothetical protein
VPIDLRKVAVRAATANTREAPRIEAMLGAFACTSGAHTPDRATSG